MDSETYLARLASAVDRFTRVIERSNLDQPVPACPEWDVAALVDHVVVIHTWVSRILADGAASSVHDTIERPERDPGTYAAWYTERAASLQAELAAVDLDAACWNFTGLNQTFGFWPRRQMNEVNVHSFDAAAAAGGEIVIESDAAADGIDELLTVMVPRMAQRGIIPDLTAPLAIAPTDLTESWTVHPPDDSGSARVVRGDSGAAATVSGPAADLFLALWKRLPPERLTIAGDVDVALAYLASQLAP